MPEPHEPSRHNRMNILRASVLGANEGIVSVAALLLGVIVTGASDTVIFGAGLAFMIVSAVSMALGKYVAVSSQRDTEKALIEKEAKKLAKDSQAEHAELLEIPRPTVSPRPRRVRQPSRSGRVRPEAPISSSNLESIMSN